MPDEAIPERQSGDKACHKCGASKPMTDFYAQPGARDGRDNSCKECRKELVKENRRAKSDYYQAYDRKRYRDDPKRKEAARKSASSPAGLASRTKSLARSKIESPEKQAARNAISNGLRDGKIKREPCYFCGRTDKIHAHHEDYAHPLDVFWLCPSCHGKLHTIKGDMRRASK